MILNKIIRYQPRSGLYPRFLFWFRYKAVGKVTSALRRLALQSQGMRIGCNTPMPSCFVTWPHQVEIGSNCRLEHHIYFHFDGIYENGPRIQIGDGCFIGCGVEFNIRCKVTIGEKSLIAAGSRFVDHDHSLKSLHEPDSGDGTIAPIQIDNQVWIGANSVVLKGVTIGKGAVVGAGSVVTRSIPANEIWAGVPARKIGLRE